MFKDVKKILIFKLCCYGDAVFITPSIKSLKINFPNAKIIYAHAKWIESMMEYIPFIDGHILFENVYSKSVLKKIAGAVKFIVNVRKEKFDLVLFGHRSNLLAFIIRLCGIPSRLGFQGTKFLTHRGKFLKTLPEYQRYLSILTENNLTAVNSKPELVPLYSEKAREILGLRTDERLLGIYSEGGHNPGTEMSIKKWGFGNYLKLAEMINCEFPEIKIIFFEGTYEDEKITLPNEIRAYKKTISNELISCCDYFISGDTGSLHMAAAMGVSTLSIFGPSDPRVLAPVNAEMPGKHKVIWKKPPCSPCYTPDTAINKSNKKYWQDGKFICHTGTHGCMKSIRPEEVFFHFTKMLELVKQD